MAVSGIPVIAKAFVDVFEAVLPGTFGIPVIKVHDRANRSCVFTVGGNVGKALFNDAADSHPVFHKTF